MDDFIPLKCSKCGSKFFEIPANLELDDAVRCRYCGFRVVIYLLDGFESVPHPVRAAGVGNGSARLPAAAQRTATPSRRPVGEPARS